MIIESHNLEMKTEHALRSGKSVSTELFSRYMDIQASKLQEQEQESSQKQEELKSATLDKVFHLTHSERDIFEETLLKILNESLSTLKKHSANESDESRRRLLSQSLETKSSYYGQESYAFSTTGIVKSSSGSFNIDVDFALSRSFMMQEELSTEKFMDPLVINVVGDMPTLQSEGSFSFDLDSDGNRESLALLNRGSGFLALDKNSDGHINDGSELFGAKSGFGFKELAQYDEDQNSWIDEADAIFDKLKIWFKNSDEDKLSTLKEEGVGAIYLDAKAGDFNFKTKENLSLGKLRASSLFLKESGEVGSVVQIDLASKQNSLQPSPLQEALQA